MSTETKAEKMARYKATEEKLPVGMAEFHAWADDILDTYDMPNNDSTKFALATAIMHAKNGQGYFSRDFFGQVLIKGAANQVAHAVMTELKEKQERLAAEEKAQAEAAKAESNG
jgi:hypothetical protein